MEVDAVIEGFVRQPDGTAGVAMSPGNWNAENNLAIYHVREMLCYLLHSVDFSILKNGLTEIANMRELAWKNFAPFEISKIGGYITKCNPIPIKKVFLLDASFYASVSFKLLFQMLPNSLVNAVHIVSSSEVLNNFPNILLPPSLMPSTTVNVGFTHLSVEEQACFQFLVDC